MKRYYVWIFFKKIGVSVFVYFQRDGMARFQKEEEEKTLKAITLFCFPEGINWAPLTEYHRLVLHTIPILETSDFI